MPKELKHDSSYIHHLLTEVKQMPEEVVKNFKGLVKMIEDTRFKNNEQAILNYSCLQTYIAATNMMTVSAMEQIDSCAIGGYNQEAVEKILIKHNLLDKEKFYLTLMVAFGYRVNEPAPKTRQPLDDLVVWVK